MQLQLNTETNIIHTMIILKSSCRNLIQRESARELFSSALAHSAQSKGHLQLIDNAAIFLSRDHSIDTIVGIISPESDFTVSSNMANQRFQFEQRYEMTNLACEEHNSQETGKNQMVYITTDAFDESQIDNVDFRFVIDRIKNEIKEQFPTENLLVLFVCGGDMFIVGISRDVFQIVTETNVRKKFVHMQ